MRKSYAFAVAAAIVALAGCDSDKLPDDFGQIIEAPETVPSCVLAQEFPTDLNAPELFDTPREDALAEQLAIVTTGDFVASQALYERFSTDLEQLRASYPRQLEGTLLPCWYQSVIVSFDQDMFAQVNAGNYDQWDEIHQILDIESFDYLEGLAMVTIRYYGRYHLATLADAYNELSGVLSADPNLYVSIGAPDRPQICAAEREDGWYYITSVPEPNCTGTCAARYSLFQSNQAGEVKFLEAYNTNRPAPGWFQNFASCRARM